MHNPELIDETGDYSAEAIRTWLQDVISKTGMRPTPLAKAAGLAPSTLLRALDPDHPGSLERRSIEKIVKRFNLSPPVVYKEWPRPSVEAELAATPYNHDIFGFPPKESQSLWTIRTRAVELAGLLPGDIVLVDREIAPAHRDAVMAQLADYGLGTTETVIRVYDPPYLLTETCDPRARRKPLPVDNDRVSIWGVVVRSVRIRE